MLLLIQIYSSKSGLDFATKLQILQVYLTVVVTVPSNVLSVHMQALLLRHPVKQEHNLVIFSLHLSVNIFFKVRALIYCH